MKSSTDTDSSASESASISSIFSIFLFGSILGEAERSRTSKLVVSNVAGHYFLEHSCYIRHDRDHPRILNASGSQHAERADRGSAANPVRCRDERAVLQGWRAVFAADRNKNAVGAFRIANDAFVQDLQQSRFLSDSGDELAEPFEIGKVALGEDVRRTVDINLSQ